MSGNNYYNILHENDDESSPEPTKNCTPEWADDETVVVSNCNKNNTKSTDNIHENLEIQLVNNVRHRNHRAFYVTRGANGQREGSRSAN